MKNSDRVEKAERLSWLKLHLQACMGREVEVVMFKGEPIYGKLAGFDLEARPSFIIIETDNSKIFVNLFRVERVRVPRC